VAAGGSSGEALAKLGAAGADAGSWGELAQFLAGAWRERGELMEEVLRAHARPSDWRRIIALSADSIMQEREQFERVCTILAPGLAPEAIAL
jgi:hypothetical protein